MADVSSHSVHPRFTATYPFQLCLPAPRYSGAVLRWCWVGVSPIPASQSSEMKMLVSGMHTYSYEWFVFLFISPLPHLRRGGGAHRGAGEMVDTLPQLENFIRFECQAGGLRLTRLDIVPRFSIVRKRPGLHQYALKVNYIFCLDLKPWKTNRKTPYDTGAPQSFHAIPALDRVVFAAFNSTYDSVVGIVAFICEIHLYMFYIVSLSITTQTNGLNGKFAYENPKSTATA